MAFINKIITAITEVSRQEALQFSQCYISPPFYFQDLTDIPFLMLSTNIKIVATVQIKLEGKKKGKADHKNNRGWGRGQKRTSIDYIVEESPGLLQKLK